MVAPAQNINFAITVVISPNLFAGTKCSSFISPPNSTTVSVETLMITDRFLLFYLEAREIADRQILQARQIKVTN